MCGIAGIVSADQNERIDATLVHRMCQMIVHRGPDDEGIYARGPAALGMRRLSIIDVAGGHQPIHNENKTVWVVFNGEIYNFQELRAELKAAGHAFYTNTDTEVIVHLYEEYQADCVRKLRGMFAFAVFDETNQRLVLARDRLGIKPLHYACYGDQLLFGSEIKAILAAAPEQKALRKESLLSYFHFGYIPDPATAFEKIQKLPPGYWLEWTNGHLKVKRYWDLPVYGSHELASEEECLQELESRLLEAVRIRLIAEVPLGALLSGGVDSSIVVALMARASSSPVKTFSIGFSKRDFDEAPYARQVARQFGTDHYELFVEPNINEALEVLTRSLEEPFGDSSMIPTYYICRLARQHVTVALSGDGGDELFAGYERYGSVLRRAFGERIPSFLGRWYRDQLCRYLPAKTYGRNFLYNASLPLRDRYLDYISWLPASSRESAIFTKDFLDWAARAPSPVVEFRNHFDHGPAQDHLSQLLYTDTKAYLPGDILTKVDRMSMLSSLEARVPLLDHPFVEFVTGLPAHWKFRNGEQKYILKRLAERLGVPREVIYRPKQGFALPLVHWIREDLHQDLIRVLLEPRTLQRGYFNARAMRETLEEHTAGRRDRSSRIWRLLILELWHRNFLETWSAAWPFASARACENINSLSQSF